MPEVIKRAVIKLTGETFGKGNDHISFEQYRSVARQLIDIKKDTGLEMVIVVGGGNIFRGRQAADYVDKNEADFMGVTATVINGIGLRDAMNNNNCETRLMTAMDIKDFAEPYIMQKGRHHLDNGRTVIIAGGLGRPNFTTDSAAAQYAAELACDILCKASTTNGVYDCDPKKNPNAVKYSTVSYRTALDNRLGVMDNTAFAMCENSQTPIFVFDIADLGRLPDAIRGDYSFGTLVTN